MFLFQGAFYLYTGIALLGFLLFLWILPETKGKSLEEMEHLFSQPILSCQRRRRDSETNLITQNQTE